MALTKKNKSQSTQYLKRYNGQLITACKQYCLAAGATQGNIAYTQTVMTIIFLRKYTMGEVSSL
jgi:hypothetical protein